MLELFQKSHGGQLPGQSIRVVPYRNLAAPLLIGNASLFGGSQGRAEYNPLKAVNKLARKDTFNRRALSVDELVRLVAGSGKRGFAYLVAGCTGFHLRRSVLFACGRNRFAALRDTSHRPLRNG